MGADQGTKMTLALNLVRSIQAMFPGSKYYIEDISFEKVFDQSVIRDHIIATHEDELAQHLLCSPHFLIISRTVAPKDGAFYIRVFENQITLNAQEKEIYQKYYPTKHFLLIAPTIPEAAILAEFLNTGKTNKDVEKLLK